jgi:hypothetical protein
MNDRPELIEVSDFFPRVAPPLNPLKGTLSNMEAKSPSGDLGAVLTIKNKFPVI